MTNAWKVYGIIITAVLLVVLGVFGWLFKLGNDALVAEQRCATVTCAPYSGGYTYDEYAKVCRCYNANEDAPAHTEILGD